EHRPPAAELGQIEAVARARVDDEFRHRAWLSRLEPLAVRRRGHVVARADKDEGWDLEAGAGFVGAWGVERRRGLEARIAPAGRGGDLERGVRALREADRADPRLVDERESGEEGEGAVGVGRRRIEIDGAGLLQAAGCEVVDEQSDVTPVRDLLAERRPVSRQA